MSLNSFLKLIDDDLEAVFNQRREDPAKGRKPLLNLLSKIEKQRSSGAERGTGWKVKNGAVLLVLRLQGKALEIAQHDSFYIPESEFEAALGNLVVATNAGELDSAIAATKMDQKPARKARSPEANARAAATRKANAEAKLDSK